jgi:alpha-beta hydrolase superfamily lysophospholipase
MGKTLWSVLYILIGLFALYAAAMAWLWLRQERLIFFPEPLPPDARLVRDADVQEVSVKVPGAILSALHLRLPNPRGLVFFLHGNAGNLASWFVAAERYRAANYDLFMLDYRGYGKSSGRIESEAQLRADVRAAWDQVAPAYPGKPVVVYGRSLGSGLAAGLSAQLSQSGQPPAMTVLVSPYRSMAALSAHHYPFVPQALLRYPLRTEDEVPLVRGPLLLLHGLLDTVIPHSHSDALAQAARSGGAQARVVKIEGAAHNDLQEFETYLKAFFGALPG